MERKLNIHSHTQSLVNNIRSKSDNPILKTGVKGQNYDTHLLLVHRIQFLRKNGRLKKAVR